MVIVGDVLTGLRPFFPRKRLTMLLLVAFFLQPTILGFTMAATDCPPQQFWNGTACNTCSGCPLGLGVKTRCTSKKDTECQSCWLGFDFSNTTGMEECKSCDEYSNCLDGNAKIVKNCTLVSPPVCQGCADGNFFHTGSGEHGGCIECLPPCGFHEIESRKCTTEHDRQCIKQLKDVVPITIPNNITTKADDEEERSSNTYTDADGTERPLKGPDGQQTQASEEKSFIEKNLPWVIVISAIVPMLALSLLLCRRWRRRRRRRKNQTGRLGNDNNPDGPELGRLLSPLRGGLDSFIRDLPIEDRRVIAQRLNGKYHDGYYYWQIVAEKLALRDASRDWERAENPTEKLLSAYGEKDGSTIRNFIKALKEADMTLLASQLENKFTTDTHKEEEVENRVTDTWV